MGVKWKTTINKLPIIETHLKGLKDKKIKIGALDGENAWLEAIHEYGCRIKVTPKMRAYLHSQGLHLKNSTQEIVIPERAFLRNGHDTNADRIMEQTGRAVAQVVVGKMTPDDMLDLCGQQFVTAIKMYMRDLKDPPNHPFTIEQKGSSNPLIDTSAMLESISYKKEG